MFQEEYNTAAKAAASKYRFLQNNPAGYFMASMMAGLFIAIGSITMGIVGSLGLPGQKILNGLVFSVGLCLVTIAGAELFTGNNFVMAAGIWQKAVTLRQALKLWIICYIGNFVGSVLTAVLFQFTGLATGDVSAYLASIAAAKMTGAPLCLFAKALLCNVLVCLAIWCGMKLKSEGARMLMNYACVTTFVSCGFEHSIANMTFLTLGLLNPLEASIHWAGLVYNLAVVTAGNMVGGIVFVALPYYLISRS